LWFVHIVYMMTVHRNNKDSSRLPHVTRTLILILQAREVQLGVAGELAPIDASYLKQTSELIDMMEGYLQSQDPYDAEHIRLFKALKPAILAWSAKYAKGGQTRNPSAGKTYILCDTFLGQFNANGVSPFGRGTAGKIARDIEDIRAVLA